MPVAAFDLLATRDLPGFARANGWTYDAVAKPLDRTASPAQLSAAVLSTGLAYDRIAGNGWEVGRLIAGGNPNQAASVVGRPVTPADYGIPEGIGLGYLAITMARNLPQMILKSTADGRDPWIGVFKRPAKGQEMLLEGDFNSHFRLFVPNGYERDALYIFTPDLMALLIHETGDLDVEVKDNHLIVYRAAGFNLTDPATWARFERIHATVGAKAWRQTDMYQDPRGGGSPTRFDDRTASNAVGPVGVRLRTRLSKFATIAVAVMAGFFVVPGIVWFAGFVFMMITATQVAPGSSITWSY